jgi:hypothetical protein
VLAATFVAGVAACAGGTTGDKALRSCPGPPVTIAIPAAAPAVSAAIAAILGRAS